MLRSWHADLLCAFSFGADCGVPLTGSHTTKKAERYPYYRCRNPKCKAVNIRKEQLEREFVKLLHRFVPSEDFRLLFRDVVTEVWNATQADARAEQTAIRQQLSKLKVRKNALVHRYLDHKFSEQTYQEQDERLIGRNRQRQGVAARG